MMAINITVVLLLSLIPYIDWAAHVFGLLAGALLGLWYFGPALCGPAFAFDAPAPAAARREAARRAHEEALATPPGFWARAGVGYQLGTGERAPEGPPPAPAPPSCAARAAEATSIALCAPLLPAAAACCGSKAEPPPGLWRGAAIAACGLGAYLALLAAGFALLYGGFVDASLRSATVPLFFPCYAAQQSYPTLRCPY